MRALRDEQADFDKQEWRRASWLASMLIAATSGKQIGPSELLPAVWPRRRGKTTDVISEKDRPQELAELKKRLNIT